ncbi:MAG: metal ABC transporter substrate-binding protein [Candidatus Nanopelagicales bacterium]|nr:metal ABC transporter substrate-binding protein [Candidatus Nanopelagicales bacterium]MCF8537683.1 metal ABC transporter substrate-binding protein [Candidatus Nanopelagicales bacterium]MCF8542857.1 metal ABC transporter substrate-binding protein [Candidatus Nanopelagicales bacterium]MCF8557289.1 metal ABC transporter substrate-binding protein [Candidatus Nanopelagicales bacterium]
MPFTRLATVFIPLSLIAALLAACSGESSSNASEESAGPGSSTVVATTTILGSIAGDIVACADPAATVTTLMPVGADPHDFAPSSQQVAQIVQADLVIANGLGLEAGLDDALDNARSDGATVLEIAELVDPIPFGEHADDHADDHADEAATEDEDEHGSEDPHVWFDMTRMATAAELIGAQLATTGGTAYAECGTEVADRIRAAEAEVRATLESVPADRRILVTDHDALGYLADAYGYEIAGTVIPSGTTLAEPSSADLAELVSVIVAEDVPAIFANSAEPSTLADAVAAETGRDVQVVSLYVGSLGEPGSGAEDYLSMMATDANLIATALTR